MTQEQNYKTRMRVNFSQSTKNMITADITFEAIDSSKEEVIRNAKELLELALVVAKLKTEQLNF